MKKTEKAGRSAEPAKKPYVRPELECASVYEAAAGTTNTCCKASNRTCSIQGRSGMGKDQRRQTLS
jgi:hypothetical protein